MAITRAQEDRVISEVARRRDEAGLSTALTKPEVRAAARAIATEIEKTSIAARTRLATDQGAVAAKIPDAEFDVMFRAIYATLKGA